MPGVLVIDDDRSVVLVIRSACKDMEIDVHAAQSAEQGLSMLREVRPDVLLLDIMLPGTTGIELFERIRKADERVPVIFITAGGESETAIEAMKLGGLDFLLKPLDVGRVKHLIDQGLQIRRLMETPVEFPEARSASDGEHRLIGRSPLMLEVYKAIGRVAPQAVTVLILGESGTGKELIARALYQHSQRRDKPFLAVNCAALPETLLESELFGHEKGAFTGADHRRIGKFEQCNGGTIFLDEVGDMAPVMQAKLLRLLQEQRFERIGGNETIQTDVRIITATNRDLESMSNEGTFRPDLFYRLNGFTIKLPPLRARVDDLKLLIDHFLARYSRELDKPVQRVAPEAMKMLLEYAWPGNVRELQAVLRKALLNLTGPILLAEFLPPELRHSGSSAGERDKLDPARDLGRFLNAQLASGSTNIYAAAVEFMERYVVTRILESTMGNQSRASKLLGITRGSLRNKIRALGLKIDQVVTADEEDLEAV